MNTVKAITPMKKTSSPQCGNLVLYLTINRGISVCLTVFPFSQQPLIPLTSNFTGVLLRTQGRAVSEAVFWMSSFPSFKGVCFAFLHVTWHEAKGGTMLRGQCSTRIIYSTSPGSTENKRDPCFHCVKLYSFWFHSQTKSFACKN